MSIVGVALFQHLLGAQLVSNMESRVNFFDFEYVSEYADAFWQNPIQAYVFPNQVFENPYIYGFLVLPFFKLTGLLAIPPIFFVLTTFSILIWFVITSIETMNKLKFFLVLILFGSPPICLLFNRGNIDLLIAVLIILAGLAFSKSKYGLGLSALAVTCLLKFYLFPAFLLIGFWRWRKSVLGLTFLVSICLVGALNYRVIDKSWFPKSWESSFGPGALTAVFKMGGLPYPAATSAITSLMIIGAIGYLTYRTVGQDRFIDHGVSAWVFLISSSTYIFTCLFITTYSYRLYLLLLCVPLVSTIFKRGMIFNVFWITLLPGFFFNNPRALGIAEIHLVIVAVGLSNICLLVVSGMLLGIILNLKDFSWHSKPSQI
jgi:hypothetical protein